MFVIYTEIVGLGIVLSKNKNFTYKGDLINSDNFLIVIELNNVDMLQYLLNEFELSQKIMCNIEEFIIDPSREIISLIDCT